MRSTILLLLLAAACSRASASGTDDGPTNHYCNLHVFTDAELAHHHDLSVGLAAAVTGWRELDDGYEIDFAGGFQDFGVWLDDERRCCPTLHYQVEMSPMAGPAVLRITGNQAKAFIREEFGRLMGDRS